MKDKLKELLEMPYNEFKDILDKGITEDLFVELDKLINEYNHISMKQGLLEDLKNGDFPFTKEDSLNYIKKNPMDISLPVFPYKVIDSINKTLIISKIKADKGMVKSYSLDEFMKRRNRS